MKLVVSVRRSHRDHAPRDWIEQVRALDGLSVLGDPMFGRCVVEVGRDAENALRERFGAYLHIEPIITHRKLSGATRLDEGQ